MKNKKPKFRHEKKYLISSVEKQALLKRLEGILARDVNGSEKGYTIRSLYFDDYYYSSYEEKLAGTFGRKKYRIRIYNYLDNVIKLECKEKQGSYIHKEAAVLSREETECIIKGDYRFLLNRPEKLCKQFYVECMTKRMRPVVFVDYEREAFVMHQGDVRITFDNHVRSAWMNYSMFDSSLPSFDVFDSGTLVMEVKFTEFLPEIVRQNISPDNAIEMAASKYTMCLEKKWEISSR